MKNQTEKLLERYPALTSCQGQIDRAIELLVELFRRDGTLFCCGNGGSAADADHICGEFLKGFLLKRPLPEIEKERFRELFGEEGVAMGGQLQAGLRSVSLLSHPGFISAFCNDVNPDLIYAQQLYALGREDDVLLAISTGGNAVNVRFALMAARAKGIKSILLTGNRNGVCEKFADLVIAAPESETYRIQELHLPIYHTLCMAAEAALFGEES